MQTIHFAATTLLVWSLAPQDAQDPTPPIRPPVVSRDDPGAQLLASDGKPVAPGRVPEGTSPEALALWQRLLAATATAEVREPIRAFDLVFEVRLRHEGGNNNFDSSFAFLDVEDGYVRGRIDRKDRVSMRGPQGDWTVEKGQKVRLRGREFEADRKQLDEWVAIARNYIALTRPDGVALVSLRERKVQRRFAEAGLFSVELDGGETITTHSPALAKQAQRLAWLEVESPDFRLYQSATAARGRPVYRALLGLDPETGDLELALLNEQRSKAVVIESSLLVVVPSWCGIDGGYRVPQQLVVHRVDLRTSPASFEERPGLDLFLKKADARINPELEPQDFNPR